MVDLNSRISHITATYTEDFGFYDDYSSPNYSYFPFKWNYAILMDSILIKSLQCMHQHMKSQIRSGTSQMKWRTIQGKCQVNETQVKTSEAINK